MLPEAEVFIRESAGIATHQRPSPEELARATVQKPCEHRVALWERHGCVAVGENPVEAFEHIPTPDKAARALPVCRSAGFELQGFGEAELERPFCSGERRG